MVVATGRQIDAIAQRQRSPHVIASERILVSKLPPQPVQKTSDMPAGDRARLQLLVNLCALAKTLTDDEASRIAIDIARLPVLLQRGMKGAAMSRT